MKIFVLSPLETTKCQNFGQPKRALFLDNHNLSGYPQAHMIEIENMEDQLCKDKWCNRISNS